jgi:hypothetical protein
LILPGLYESTEYLHRTLRWQQASSQQQLPRKAETTDVASVSSAHLHTTQHHGFL